MRVVVVGATGNVGTAVLKALRDTPKVSSILGIARRMPDRSRTPYSDCEWSAIDIAAASQEHEALSQLSSAFAGADAVIHLAWLNQPTAQRRLLRRVNVDGTARVARAAAAAQVPHLIVASSVAAYSLDDGRARRSEDWPVAGIPASPYSADKAAQEGILDDFSRAHPEVMLTRIRPALTLQADAASEFQRYYLNRWAPVRLLKHVRPPVLPVPKRLHGLQIVHADDLGLAFAGAVVKPVSGAFNICADDILEPKQLAGILDHGRYVEIPLRLFRAFVCGARGAHLLAADTEWLDLALAVPMMDNGRAKNELGWQPRHTAAEALSSVLRAIEEGRGAGSLPLRPRDPDDAHLHPARAPAHIGADAGGTTDPLLSEEGASRSQQNEILGIGKMSQDLLGLYLSDHLTGATAGASRMERMSAVYLDTPVYARLSELAEELRLERAFLRNLMRDMGLRRRRHRQLISWVGEKLGRLKSNGRVLSRSPMTLVLESEIMRGAVMGKLGLWQTLHAHAAELDLDPQVFSELATVARRQASVLDDVHEFARERAFRRDLATSGMSSQNEA